MTTVRKEKELLHVAQQSVKMAGSFIRLMSLTNMEIFQKKTNAMYNRVVTNFDLNSERLIKREIRMRYSDHEIHAEESKDEMNEITDEDVLKWYIDPLDGTKAFIKGNLSVVTLSVACCDAKGPLVAAIYNPFTDILYSASRSGPALLNGKEFPTTQAFLLSRSRILIDYSSFLDKKIQRKLSLAEQDGIIGRSFKYDGSIAQHLCLIAQGTLDGAVFYGTGKKGAYWDIAGAILILNRQNIKITNFDRKKITPESQIFDQLIVAPPKVHTQLIKWVNKL